jgi:transcriptional regulator with XRE-family HTH domain
MLEAQSMSIRNKIIGVLVRRARLEAGKTQRECARPLGLSASVYSQYEQGNRGFSLPQLEALAYFLDVPRDSLWDERYASAMKQEEGELPLEQMLQLRRKMLAVRLRQCRKSSGLSRRKISDLLGCSIYMVGQYEQGTRDIPLAELEILAERCGESLASFMDQDTIPKSESQQLREAAALLRSLPPEMQDFVLNPTNALYIRVAMKLSALEADSLRQIAETLLDITY